MKKIAIANLKGGVGKSTTTMFMAEHWARAGDRILVIDLDPQASSTTMLLSEKQLVNAEHAGRCLPDFLQAAKTSKTPLSLGGYIIPRCSDLRELQSGGEVGFVSIVPALPKMWFDMYELDGQFFAAGRDPVGWLRSVLDGAIDAVATQYDYVLIDCPPGLGSLARAGLAIADEIVAPTLADYVSVRSLHDFRFAGLNKLGLDPVHRLHVVVSKFAATDFQRRVLDVLRSSGCPIVDPPISMSNVVLLASENVSGRLRTYGQKYRQIGDDIEAMTRALKAAIMQN